LRDFPPFPHVVGDDHQNSRKSGHRNIAD
jgi:hypothetical protein